MRHGARLLPAGCSARRDSQQRRRVNETLIHNHPEEQVRPNRDPATPDRADPLSRTHHSVPFGNRRRHKPQMAVNANKPVMLNQDFQSSGSFPLHTNDRPRGDRPYRPPNRGRQINPVVKRVGKR